MVSDWNDNEIRNVPTKKWSAVATFYSIWGATFFLWDYGYILLTKYRRAAPLGLIMGFGALQYLAFFVYVLVALYAILYWVTNRKKSSVRAIIPILIVCITLIVYVLYIIFITPHIDGGGLWYKFILFEKERLLS